MLEGRKILVTGVSGLLAGGIADQIGRYNDMWGIARFTQPGSRERVEAAGVKTVVGDIAEGQFDGLPDDFEYVLHIAANTKPGTQEVAMRNNAEATGLLMHRFRNVKAFLFVSNSSLLLDNPDPLHRYLETDHVGGSSPHSANYAPTKLASEGVVRALSRIYDIPATIARMNVGYGGIYDDGGLPGKHLEALLERRPIRLPTSKPHMTSPIHEDDIVGQLEALLNAASVPPTIVNWGGAEGVSTKDWVQYMADLIGVEPVFEYDDSRMQPNRTFDTTRGRELGLEWKVGWKEGMRRMIQARHPELKLKEG
jgi:UDP-glucuronate 4-epimerase